MTRWLVRGRLLAIPLLALAVAAAPLAVLPTAATAADPQGVTSVVAQDTQVVVSGTAPAGASVDVQALGVEADPSTAGDDIAEATATARTDGTFTASVPRGGDADDPYYAKFVAVVDGEALGTHRFVDDVQVTPISDFAYPEALSKKGLQVQPTDDAEELGNQHAGINVAFNELMQLEDEGPENTITFVSQGREFYFDRTAVEDRDRQIKPLSDNNQIVNLILLVYASSDPNSAASVLIHPDADPSGGPVFGFNTATAEGVAYYTAAMEFVTQRYTREDEQFGRAVGYIVSNEVDAQWTWSNMGEKTLDEFLVFYERALRITDRAARAAYSGARTYTSLTHAWTIPAGANPDPENPTRYYEVKDFVDGLNALTKAHGDYPWYVAHHPYPENLFDPAFWEDTTATSDVETTPRITFKNIELLPEYLGREQLLYQGQPRRIILSEQGCNTPGEGLEAEQLQAACYALAYYKVRFLDSIDNFILHRHVDHKVEGGLRLGLWTWDDARPEPSSPDEQKVIYDVFKYIDTERSLEVTDFALDVIGIDDWAELVPGWDPTQLAQRPLPEQVGARTGTSPRGGTVVADFADGTDGWRISDNVQSVRAQDGVLQVGFDALDKLWRGTDVVLDEPLDASSSPRLSMRLRMPADEAPDRADRQLEVKVKAYSGDAGQIAEGVAPLVADGEWNDVAVDLSGFSGVSAVDRIKVWVRGGTNSDWAGTYDLDDVAFSGSTTPPGPGRNIALTAVAQEPPAAGTPVTLTVTNRDWSTVRGVLRPVTCEGVELSGAPLRVSGLAPGESVELTVEVISYEPTDAAHPVLCFTHQGGTVTALLEAPDPEAVVVYGFDDGTTQGWQAGAGVDSVSAVSSFANGPTAPQAGSYALDAAAAVGPAGDPKVVFVEPAQPLDLSDAAEVVVWVDSYGGAPGATGYEVVLTLFSGTESVSVTSPDYQPDRWNEVVLDVSGWEGRSAVTRAEVSFRAVGSTFPTWNPHFQVDTFSWWAQPRS